MPESDFNNNNNNNNVETCKVQESIKQPLTALQTGEQKSPNH